MRRRLWWVLFAALLVVGVGLAAIHTAGGSRTLVIVQGVAGLAAVGLAAGLAVWKPQPGDKASWVLGGLALLFMASPLLAEGLDGAHRWIGVGPIQMQPAALSLPVLVWLATRAGSRWLGPVVLAAAAGICAQQPDQQAATGVAAGLPAIALLYGRSPLWLAALGAGIASWIFGGLHPSVAPVPYVEQVLRLTFESHWAAGLLTGMALAAIPFLMLIIQIGANRTQVTLAAMWIGLCIASLNEAFPAPVVGYGLSWVLAFGLSLGLAAADRR